MKVIEQKELKNPSYAAAARVSEQTLSDLHKIRCAKVQVDSHLVVEFCCKVACSLPRAIGREILYVLHKRLFIRGKM